VIEINSIYGIHVGAPEIEGVPRIKSSLIEKRMENEWDPGRGRDPTDGRNSVSTTYEQK
jgi:hypothetical protein